MDKPVLPELPAGFRWKVGTSGTKNPKVLLQKRRLGIWFTIDYGLILTGPFASAIKNEIENAARVVMHSRKFEMEVRKYFGIYQ